MSRYLSPSSLKTIFSGRHPRLVVKHLQYAIPFSSLSHNFSCKVNCQPYCLYSEVIHRFSLAAFEICLQVFDCYYFTIGMLICNSLYLSSSMFIYIKIGGLRLFTISRCPIPLQISLLDSLSLLLLWYLNCGIF